MPIYQCSAPKGLLSDDMKGKIATAITDAYVEATGAPRVFVHVFFNELPPGISYLTQDEALRLAQSSPTARPRADRPDRW